jgi:hypothetical protein
MDTQPSTRKQPTVKQTTRFFRNLITEVQAEELLFHIEQNTEWEDGPRSRKGFTRKAIGIDVDALYGLLVLFPVEDKTVWDLVKETIDSYSVRTRCNGAYINYYRNGEDWTPNHTHKNTSQFVLSLGETRTLQIGKNSHQINSGDAVLFGSSVHGICKDDSTKPRISIALFLEQ